MRFARLVALLVAVTFPAAVQASSAQTWNLTGNWSGSAGTVMQLKQSGTSVTWYARAGDGVSWAHDFAGTISGSSISGTFQDRAGYQLHNHGTIGARISDDCHFTITQVSVNGGAPSGGGEVFTKSPCLSKTLVPIESVSNGCGGAGWDTVVHAQNYVGNSSTYHDSNVNPLSRSYTVDFVDACNLHDAGYSGAVVRDKLNGGTKDFSTWSRKRVDDEFRDNMRLLCERRIPASAKTARENCKGRGGNFSIGAESRYNFVRRWGYLFFDADPTQAGVQRTGLRANN